jgi:hypothetical protein
MFEVWKIVLNIAKQCHYSTPKRLLRQTEVWCGPYSSILAPLPLVSTTVQLGNGLQTLFWQDRWMDSSFVASITPALLQAVSRHAQQSQPPVAASG